MEALKWFGYIVAAIAVLSVVLGAGAFIVALIAIGGALTFAIMLVLFVASVLKWACTPPRRKS